MKFFRTTGIITALLLPLVSWSQQEESQDLPSRYEFERFGKDLDTLRDGVERAAAKLERLTGER